jgi:ribosome biogenesis GTPase / thiamine phosphate phosphatase
MSPPRNAGPDEDDVRVRAARSSRPRTRRRPAHAEAIEAFVAGVDRGRYRCVIDDRTVTAMKARELGRGNIVVGDTVSLAGDVSGAPGTLARVVRVEPRRSVLRRSADDTDPVERAIVANADQLLIVCALADPPPRLRLIDRFLVAAYDSGLEPVLCLTKADLAGPEEILPVYEPLGLRYVVLGRPMPADAVEELRGLLIDQISVFVGHSGVGKSTLVNLLIPDADRAVGTVSPVTGRGRHTSSSAVALRVPGGGWLIDTPGLRSFGLGHMSPENVVAAFPDLIEATADCPPGCDHLGPDWIGKHQQSGIRSTVRIPDCALEAAAGTQGALAARLDSLRRLLRSLEGNVGQEENFGQDGNVGQDGAAGAGTGVSKAAASPVDTDGIDGDDLLSGDRS